MVEIGPRWKRWKSEGKSLRVGMGPVGPRKVQSLRLDRELQKQSAAYQDMYCIPPIRLKDAEDKEEEEKKFNNFKTKI